MSYLSTRTLVIGGLLAVALFYGGPLLMLLAGTFRSAPPGLPAEWSLEAWRLASDDPRIVEAISNSLLIAGLNLFVSVPLAAILVFLAQRTDCHARRWVTPAMLVMFTLPSLFYAMGYALLANPYTGLLNLLLKALPWESSLRVNIESWAGLALVNLFRSVAFLYLFLLGAFQALNSEQEEASLCCGRSMAGTFLRVSLPSLLPALGGAAIFAIIGGLEIFDLALIIGLPAGIEVLAVRIYDFLNGSSPPQYGPAGLLSSGLVLVVGGLILLQARLVGRKGFTSVTGKASRQRLIPLGRWRTPLSLLLWLYLLVAQLLPISALVFSSFQRYPGVYDGLTLRNYQNLVNLPGIGTALSNTLLLALLVGAVCALVGLLLAELERKSPPPLAKGVRFFAMVPLAMPGVVTALAITWAYTGIPGLRQLYGSLWLMGIALVVALSPLAIQIGQAALAQIAPDLQEAARTSGASAPRAWTQIVLRLASPSYLVSWYLAAVAIIGSLDIPLLLGGAGLNTLSTTIYTLNARGQVGTAAALLVGLFLLILTPALVASLLSWFRRRATFRSPDQEPLEWAR